MPCLFIISFMSCHPDLPWVFVTEPPVPLVATAASDFAICEVEVFEALCTALEGIEQDDHTWEQEHYEEESAEVLDNPH